ncbi:MAG: phosphopantothenoylcysteine decarboxylase [Verrucomicrobiae bacterium]|nr:phosphopantothenoylcysteine decarboxylase [Verrucomicrobiae bacterium]
MKKTILLGVTGSIAAYRAADIASALTKEGHEVHAVLTQEATHFVTPLVLQTLTHQPVTVRLSEESADHPTHIALADRADLVVVAPATANFIAQASLGLAPDALTSILLATRAPILMAPAMNGKMWLHSTTQMHVADLQKRDVEFIGPEKGMLACGYEGIGRLWNVDGIVDAIRKKINVLKEK